MNGKRVATIIIGVLLIIGGIWCMVTPLATDMALVWVFGVFMFAQACGEISTYADRKAAGYADGFSLAMSIISLIFGIMLIFSWRMDIAAAEVLLFFVFFWLIVGGVMSIIGAIQVGNALGLSPVWGVVMGIIMIIGGAFGVAHPLIGAISVGIIAGMDIIVSGIELIAIGSVRLPDIRARQE
ncbi:MAG: DUF308 domain-containing protein [Lachnospiraceae bacterium]|nr:DUF308 domain-containing protein [Lachnospiraceae bacterium]MBR1524606.1 DUF308 domain-containing protein [Lachnospiraceae bacterium]